jgi:5-hydroxyisourate hydrolase
MTEGWLTTHALDTARDVPAAGLRVTLDRLDGAARERVAEAVTNADGRTDAPLLPPERFRPGRYELCCHAGDWLRAEAFDLPDPPFPRCGAGALWHGRGASSRAAAARSLRPHDLSPLPSPYWPAAGGPLFLARNTPGG